MPYFFLNTSMTFFPAYAKLYVSIFRKKSPIQTYPYKLDVHLLEYVSNIEHLAHVSVSSQLQCGQSKLRK